MTEMLATLLAAVESPAQRVRVLDVAAIRRVGAGGEIQDAGACVR